MTPRLLSELVLAGIIRGLPSGPVSKESACNARDLGLIPALGRFPGGGHGNPLQYSCQENLHGQRSLGGYNLWGLKESDMTNHSHRVDGLNICFSQF